MYFRFKCPYRAAVIKAYILVQNVCLSGIALVKLILVAYSYTLRKVTTKTCDSYSSFETSADNSLCSYQKSIVFVLVKPTRLHKI